MTWPVGCRVRVLPGRSAGVRPAYTLVEILVSTVLTLLLLMAVVQIFASVSESIANSRAALEMADQLRAAQTQLQRDLEGVTVTMSPPRRPENGEGYFEYTEGPIGPVVLPEQVAFNMNRPSGAAYEGDATVSDVDDMLMFTTRTRNTPFIGRVLVKRAPMPTPPPGETADGSDNANGLLSGSQPYKVVESTESQEAEIAWFLRGRTLYRRVLLVLPNFDADLRTSQIEMQIDTRRGKANCPTVPTPGPGFFKDYDISVRNASNGGALAANSLSDLTKPENRFAHRHLHQYSAGQQSGFPYHPHFFANWSAVPSSHVFPEIRVSTWAALRLPTLRECSFMHPLNGGEALNAANTRNSWIAGAALPDLPAIDMTNDYNGPFDAWLNPHPWKYLDRDAGALQLQHLSSSASKDPSDPSSYDPDNPPRYQGPRIGEDVILTNVIGFDVKAWDPGAPVMTTQNGTVLLPGDPGYLEAVRQYVALANQLDSSAYPRPISYGAYVDLNYLCLLGPAFNPSADLASPGTSPAYVDARRPAGIPYPQFLGAGHLKSAVRGTEPFLLSQPPTQRPSFRSSVYDTWSVHYEHNGVDENLNNLVDEGTDGFDSDSNGVVDGPEEQEAPPPYAASLRGIQVRIRVFEPASRQIREVTVVQDFLPK